MTYDEFYYAEPCRVWIYTEADRLRTERMNFETYWQGLYNYRAFQCALNEFGYALGGAKGNKPEGYLDRPIPLTAHEIEEEKQRRKQQTLAWVQKNQGE